MDVYTFHNEELTETVNKAKDSLALQLFQNDIISKETMRILMSHTILVTKRGMLGTFWNRLWKKDSNATYFFIAKVLNDPSPPDQINFDTQTEEYI